MNVLTHELGPPVRLPVQYDDYRGPPNVDGGPAGGVQSQFVQFMATIQRRKWIVIGAVVAALLAGLVVTLLMTRMYTAEASLEIQRENGGLIEMRGTEAKSTSMDQEFYETQYGLLRSRALAERVATDMKLASNANFFKTMGVRNSEEWFKPGAAAVPSVQDRNRLAGSLLLDHLEVKPERLSRLVMIGFTSPDPLLSKQVVDAWTNNFISSTLERRFGATAYARKFLESRLEQLRQKIDQSERQLVNYAAQNGIVNVSSGTSSANGMPTPDRPLLDDSLAGFSRELSAATADRISAQSKLDAGDANEALNNAAINGLRERRGSLAGDYAKMMQQFGPEYPPAEALQDQIHALDSEIARQEGRVHATLQASYKAAVERESALRTHVGTVQDDVVGLRRRSIQYNIYQRDVDTNRQLYDALLQRYKEIGVAGGVGVNNILIVDQAEVPSSPSSPKLALNLALAFLGGLAVGIAAVIALEQFDQGIADPSDIGRLLNIALLGTVPKVADGDPRLALADRKSAISEAYFSVQTSLSLSTDHGIPKTFAVTSTRPAEGKSTTAYAIAHSLARSNRRVVLVDADMRSPSVHHVLNLSNDVGLSNYLAGDDDIDRLIQPSASSNLQVVAAGPQPPSAAELLASDRLQQLIRELSQRFDQVVVDAPPVMGLADAPLIGNSVEGVIFVVEAQGTSRSMAQVAIGRLIATNVPLLGAVLVKFDPKGGSRGYGYGYGYGYGDDYGSKKEPHADL